MISKAHIPASGIAVFGLVIAGCGTGNEGGSGATSPGASATPTVSAVERADAALMTSQEMPPAPPGTLVDAGLGYTAEGDQVSAPWAQVWLCAGTSRPDEGPPTAVEPGAAAGAWGFGKAGVAQVDQYAIVYLDEASAQLFPRPREAQAGGTPAAPQHLEAG